MSGKDFLSATEWQAVAESCVGTKHCHVLSVSVEPLGGEFGGFLGDHRQVRMVVEIKAVEPPTNKDLALFLKMIPDARENDPEHVQFVIESGAFLKETGLFSLLFRHFPEPSVQWGPLCYFTRPDALVLENLMVQGFKHVSRNMLFDFNHCAILLHTLAVYHAVVFAFEENESKRTGERFHINEKYPNLTTELLFSYEAPGRFVDVLTASAKTLADVVDLIPKYKNIDIKNNIKEKMHNTIFNIFDLCTASRKFRNVLCHGDLWANNIFYKYDGDTPVEARIVDFQTARYAPPATDVMSFLYLNTTRQFRLDNEEKLISLYHINLGEELARHGYKIEEVLPWESFRESCEYYRAFGQIIAPAYHNLNMLPKGILDQHMEDPTVLMTQNRSHLVATAWKVDQYFRERLGDELSEMVDCLILRQC